MGARDALVDTINKYAGTQIDFWTDMLDMHYGPKRRHAQFLCYSRSTI
jgi:hypothetical protein